MSTPTGCKNVETQLRNTPLFGYRVPDSSDLNRGHHPELYSSEVGVYGQARIYKMRYHVFTLSPWWEAGYKVGPGFLVPNLAPAWVV